MSTNPQKKKPIGLIVGLVVVLVLLCCGGAGTAGYLLIDRAAEEVASERPESPAIPNAPSKVAGKVVRFEIEGTGRIIHLVHTTESGSTTLDDVQLPWSAETPCCDEFDYTVIGVLHGATKGPVTCRILVDGKKVVENTDPTSADCRWLPE